MLKKDGKKVLVCLSTKYANNKLFNFHNQNEIVDTHVHYMYVYFGARASAVVLFLSFTFHVYNRFIVLLFVAADEISLRFFVCSSKFFASFPKSNV